MQFGEDLQLDPWKGPGALDQVPAHYKLWGVVVHLDLHASTTFGACVWRARLMQGSLVERLASSHAPCIALQATTSPTSSCVMAGGSYVMTTRSARSVWGRSGHDVGNH